MYLCMYLCMYLYRYRCRYNNIYVYTSIDSYSAISISISIYRYRYVHIIYIRMRACMYVCMRALVEYISACVRARLCMSARACAREQRERRRNTTARPLDVCHHVGMYMCECMYMHTCVRVGSLRVCVRVRTCMCARVGSGTRARPRDVYDHVHTFIYVCMCEYMCMYECIYRFHECVRVCVCARGGMPICTMCVCIEACASRHVWMPRCAHTTHRRLICGCL